MQTDGLKEKDSRERAGGREGGKDQKQVDFPERGGDTRYRGRERGKKRRCSPQGSARESHGTWRKHYVGSWKVNTSD